MLAQLKKEERGWTKSFLTSRVLIRNCSCIVILLHLMDRKSLVDNDSGV